MTFQPELGQFAFTNTPWQELGMESAVERAIVTIGEFLELKGFCDMSPAANSGDWHENDTFKIRAYCWCDGERHPEGCPPNFEWRDFRASWYKHASRGNSQNRVMDTSEVATMLSECIASVAAETPCDHLRLQVKGEWWHQCVRCGK